MTEGRFILLSFDMEKYNKASKNYLGIILEAALLILIFKLAMVVNMSNYKLVWEFDRADIKQEYLASVDITSGRNPYNKILDGDLLINRKYTTLFPLYYYFLALIIYYSNYVFEAFMGNYRLVLFFFEAISFLFIYLYFRRVNLKLLGILAASFFILNRWTIDLMADAKQDIVAIAFIVVSLYFFKTKIKLSYLLYGISLGIKHLGIFILPVYFTPIIYKTRSLKMFLLDLSLIISPILVPSIPFLLDNLKSFVFSIVFSITRKPATTSVPFGYDKVLVFYNVGVKNNKVIYYLVPRIPLVIFSSINLILLFLKKVPVNFYVSSSIFIFIAFNPVLFDQYLTWVTPFFFFAIADYTSEKVKS